MYVLFKQHYLSDKCCFYFSIKHFERQYSKHSLELLKRSIKLWVCTCKNQNCTENQSV